MSKRDKEQIDTLRSQLSTAKGLLRKALAEMERSQKHKEHLEGIILRLRGQLGMRLP